jgi:hypothetical protein
MAINTLITLKDALIKFANDHAQIKRIEFEADDHREPKITEGDEFPMLFVAPINVQVGRAMNTHTLRIYVYERINDDRLDVLENANDTSLILRDIRVWWNDYGTDDIEIKEDLSGEFVCDRELDNVVGYFADVRFEIPSHGRCSVPISVTPNPSPTCADATANLVNSIDTLLSTTTIAAGAFADILAEDENIVVVDEDDNELQNVFNPAQEDIEIEVDVYCEPQGTNVLSVTLTDFGSSTVYYGGLQTTLAWQINKWDLATNTKTIATEINNPTYTSLADAWNDRLTINYI